VVSLQAAGCKNTAKLGITNVVKANFNFALPRPSPRTKDANLQVKAAVGLEEDDSKQGLGSCSILITQPKHDCRLSMYKQTREDVYSNYTIYALKGFTNHICLSPAFTPHRLSFSPHRYRQIRQPCLKSNQRDGGMTQCLLKRKMLCYDGDERGIMQNFMHRTWRKELHFPVGP
jgi:hypothetical protein